MKRKSVLPIIVIVFFLSLACQTLAKPATLSPEAVTPLATDVPVFTSSQLAGLIYSTYDSSTGEGALWQIGSDGEAYVIADNSYARFSPDGKQAAYINYNVQCSWLIDYEKKEAKPLDCADTSNPDFYRLDEVVGWVPGQPDTLLMLFNESIGMGGGLGYFGTLSISTGEKKTFDSQHAVSSVLISPDGESVLFSDWSYAGLYFLGGETETFDPQEYDAGNFLLAYPAWSPDGKKIAWGLMDEKADLKYAVGIFDVENKTTKILHPHSPTLAPGYADGPVAFTPQMQSPSPIWSPDGQWIAFNAGVYDETAQFDKEQSGWWMVRADGSAENKINGNFISWSPDGQWVLYWKLTENNPTKAELIVARPDGADAILLIETTKNEGNFGEVHGQVIWTPDGNRLAFMDDKNAVTLIEAGSWQLNQISGTEIPQDTQLFKWHTSFQIPYNQLTVLVPPTPSPVSDFSCPNAPRTRLQVGDTARVTFTDGSTIRLRSAPEAGDNVIDQLPEGTEFEIVDGPVCTPRLGRSDSYVYWKVTAHSRNGATGWLAEGDANAYYIEPWP